MLEIDEIKKIIEQGTDAIWSVADIYYSDFSKDFSRAIVVAQSYGQYLDYKEYNEGKYQDILNEVAVIINKKIGNLKQYLDECVINNYIPPIAQRDEIELAAPFSFKYAAAQAGLGWFGKNGVLITKEYGPRVGLGAILLDYPLKSGKPITKSFCGKCTACVDACPWNLIKGVNWTSSTIRDKLLDYQICNKKRSEYKKVHNRKNSCGHCLLVCPWGK